jgi:hypothetical protein
LRFEVVLDSGTHDPAGVSDDWLLLVFEQLEQGRPEFENGHVVGIVDQLDQLFIS